MFQSNCRVCQRGALSPYLFVLYSDDIIELIVRKSIGCVNISVVVSIIFYADDILVFATSIDSLQKLVNLSETERSALDLSINVNKSV